MKRTPMLVLALAVLAAAYSSACTGGKGTAAGPDAAEEAGHVEAPAGTVVLTPEAVAGGGIAVEPVRTSETARTIKALGELELDPRRMAVVSARSSGRLERLSAYAGDRVAAGAVLAEITSPEYLAAQMEVLQAAARAERLAGGPDEAAARSFLEAARRKLAPFGPAPAEIDALIASGQAGRHLAVRAPIAGIILESKALAGAFVADGAELLTIGDLSTLRARVHLIEKDLASVKPGLAAAVSTQAYPGRTFAGHLVLVGASMDTATRTVEGRIELANYDGALKPGMYVEARLAAAERRPTLTVPVSAVQEFAGGRIVFVRTGASSFVLRPVETGETSDGRIEILSGLAEGEAVVTAGGFLLKSELMKASLGDEHGHD